MQRPDDRLEEDLLDPPIVEITWPIMNPTPPTPPILTRVKGGLAGPPAVTGSICACGTAKYKNAPPTKVLGKVIGTGDAFSKIDDGPWCPATSVTGFNWFFKAVPNAQAVPAVPAPTGNNNRFVVWCLFGTAVQSETDTQFVGVEATSTDCEGSGLGPCGQTLSAFPEQTLVATAPRQYKVSGKGGPRAEASGVPILWVLSLRTTRCGLVWENGGDGVRTPRVELSCDGVLATRWRLCLFYGEWTASYTRPAAEWNPLACNTLTLDPGGAKFPLFPDLLTVTPA